MLEQDALVLHRLSADVGEESFVLLKFVEGAGGGS